MKTAEEMQCFLRDLCTPGELQAFAERWRIAQLLEKGEMGYREIASQTGASTTTVARVNRFLKQESYQGYALALKRLGLNVLAKSEK